MGLCGSKPKPTTRAKGHHGNLTVDGFLNYIEDGPGWRRIKSSRKDLLIEQYAEDEPLGSWRGTAMLDGLNVQDGFDYVKEKLGNDEFELLDSDEVTSSYRWLFDFYKYCETGAYQTRGIVGDHRGEGTVLMSDEHRTTNLVKQKSALSKQSNLGVVREDESRENSKNFENAPDEDDISDDDDEGEPRKEKKGSIPTLASTEATATSVELENKQEQFAALKNMGASGSMKKASKSGNWAQRLFLGGSSRKLRGSSLENLGGDVDVRTNYPTTREIIFKRQEFGLGEKQVIIAENATKKYPKFPNTTRCSLRMMGVLIEDATIKATKPKIKLTFVVSLDPELTEKEHKLPANITDAMSAFGGKLRVESFLGDMIDFFSDESNRLIQKFRQISAAPTGEHGWQEIQREKNELQLGTNIQHPIHGHGVVQSFDMKGRVQVKYDSGDVRDHMPDEKDDLRVSVQIGTRVSHPSRGPGTVKQFDEMGRVHVRFDNGEYHRYKQEAWKKKMHTYKLMGIGGALGTVKLSWRPMEAPPVREGQGRVKFAVGVPCSDVLDYILDDYKEEAKSGNVIERKILETISSNERIIYEHRKMPPPLTPRDFVLREIWKEVAPNTYVIVIQSCEHADQPEKPGCVRGAMHLTGWLLEPLYLTEEAYDGDTHISKITYQICLDPKGFVAPESVNALRNTMLLGTLTDVRVYFWKQSQMKQNLKVNNRKSKRMSFLTSGMKE